MIIQTGLVDFQVDVQGIPDNKTPPVVLLHGFTGDLHVWDMFRERLENPSVAIDLPGHGASVFVDPHREYSFQEWTRDFESILSSLKLNRIHLLGYSMGGRLALTYALIYPHRVESLILESANPGLRSSEEREARRRSDELLSRQIAGDFTGFLKKWESLPLFNGHSINNPAGWERLRDIRRRSAPDQLARALRGFTVGRQPDLWAELKNLSFPVLLISGIEDDKYGHISIEICRNNRQCTRVCVKNAGHTPHLEQPVTFFHHVHDWLISRNTTE